MSSDESKVRELAAEHGCSLWTDGNGRYRLEGDLWGPLLCAGTTLEEIQRSILSGRTSISFEEMSRKRKQSNTSSVSARTVSRFGSATNSKAITTKRRRLGCQTARLQIDREVQ
jgi:hypothetical protein